MSISADRQKALDTALGQINKKFGNNTVMKLGDKPEMTVEVIPTGSLAVDIALGVGGLPKGRIVEIYGPESSGKTLFCLQAIANTQKEGGIAAFVDAEHALDPEWAAKIGVNTEDLLVTQPESGEQALNIAESLIRSGAVDLVVIDSVAALTPQKELEGEVGDSMVGTQARMMSQALRKITAATNQTKTTVIFINQLREKIGVMFGSPETTTGGKALKFYASVRLDIRRIEQLKDGTDVVGARTRIKVVKNKVAAPFKQAEFDISFTPGMEGFSREGDIIDLGVKYEIIKKGGAWFSYNGEQLGQGKEKVRVLLRSNPELAKEIETLILAKVFPERNGDFAAPDLKAADDADLDEVPNSDIF